MLGELSWDREKLVEDETQVDDLKKEKTWKA